MRDNGDLLTVVDLLEGYRAGTYIPCIGQAERTEQRLPDGFDLDEQRAIRRILSVASDDAARAVILKGVGGERAQQLLNRALIRWRPPDPILVLEPMILLSGAGVTWLLERVGVGLTGINLEVSLWTTVPVAQPLRNHTAGQLTVEWLGSRSITDDTGKQLTYASGTHRQALPTLASTREQASLIYSTRHKESWRPGVTPEARTLTLDAVVEVAIGSRPANGGHGESAISKPVNLGEVHCSLSIPDNWRAGNFIVRDASQR